MLTDYRIRQRDHLLDIVRGLNQELDLSTVLTRILEASTNMLNGRAGLIALRETPPGFESQSHVRFNIYAQYRVAPEYLRHFDSILKDIPTGDVKHAAPHLISELNRRLYVARSRGLVSLEGAFGLPLESRGELIGLLLVFRATTAPFGPNEQELLDVFANQAAVAVTNARLFEAVNQERRQLDAILENAADGFCIMSVSHKVERWNRALARLTGITAADAIGHNYDDLFRWAQRTRGLNLVDAEAAGWPTPASVPIYVEGEVLRKDDSPLAVGVTYAPLFDRDAHLVNLIASVRDITRFREAEQLKSTFISVISHELKTPVSLIKGYAGTLRREDANWEPAVVQQSLAVIEEEADRLTGLIENLLDASRLQAGGLRLQREECQLAEIAARIAARFQTQTTIHRINTRFPDNFPIIKGDEERLGQVLSNLVSNAIKYSPDGGAITIAGRVLAQEIVVGVSDEGPGLPPDEVQRVFDRFYRATTLATERASGAGLGLYLARAIVEAHAGRIWVESPVGTGAAFLFSLPRED